MSPPKPALILMLLVGCVDDEPALETLDQEVMGAIVVQRDDGIPGGVATCTTSDVSDANLVRFRDALLTDLMPKARAVARSGAFESCVRIAVTQGSTMSVRRWQFSGGQAQQFGPLDLTGSDLGVVTTQHMPAERRRDLYASRMLSEAASPQGMTITCMQAAGGLALQVPNPTLDRARSDPFYLSKDFFNQDPSHAGFRAFTLAVIWHEMMHERGYHHPDAQVATLDEYNNTLPLIVGACMEHVFAESEQYCGFEACPGGTRMVNAINGDWGSCICEPDHAAPVLVDSWDWPGLTKVAVNGAGDGYALAWDGAQQTAYARAGHAWNSLGAASALVAGADAVAFRQTGKGTFPLQYWRIRPRVGATENVVVSTADGAAAAIDGFGTLVRTTAAGRVERHVPYFGGWEEIGKGTGVVAGSDLVYLTGGGQLQRFETATRTRTALGSITANQLAVDSYGTLHALTDGTMSRWRGAFWELLAFDVTAIGTGDDFFARSINGWVYRYSPQHGWQQVAACDSFAVGGRSMYCVRGTRLELYEY